MLGADVLIPLSESVDFGCFSKQVENTVGKREIARYEQFLLFPQCFQKACFLGASKGVIVWEWVKYTTIYG